MKYEILTIHASVVFLLTLDKPLWLKIFFAAAYTFFVLVASILDTLSDQSKDG